MDDVVFISVKYKLNVYEFMLIYKNDWISK